MFEKEQHNFPEASNYPIINKKKASANITFLCPIKNGCKWKVAKTKSTKMLEVQLNNFSITHQIHLSFYSYEICLHVAELLASLDFAKIRR